MFMADLYRTKPDDLAISPMPIIGSLQQAKETTKRLLANNFRGERDPGLRPLRARLRRAEDNGTVSEFEIGPGGVFERLPTSLSA